MITAMVGFFFILVVMVVVIIRRQIKKNNVNDGLDYSTTRLQIHLEEAADVIIKRMEEHVNQLEFLIEEANQKIVQLDQYMKKIEKLEGQKKEVVQKELSENTVKLMEPVMKEPTTSCIDKPKIMLKESAINTEVFHMLGEGFSLDEISKKTGVGKGAIKLIKQMYKNKKLS